MAQAATAQMPTLSGSSPTPAAEMLKTSFNLAVERHSLRELSVPDSDAEEKLYLLFHWASRRDVLRVTIEDTE